MKRSKHQLAKEAELVQKTILLYRQGLTYRQIEPIIGRSRQWISIKIRKHYPQAFDNEVLTSDDGGATMPIDGDN